MSEELIEAVREGLIDVITSAHAPAPAEDKRRPFAEAAPGAVGLETLLPAALTAITALSYGVYRLRKRKKSREPLGESR